MEVNPAVKLYSFLSDYGAEDFPSGVKIIYPGSPYSEQKLPIHFNGKLQTLKAYTYEPRIIHFEKATVLCGRYPHVGNNIWVHGATYFSDQIELPGDDGIIAADEKALRLLMKARRTYFIEKAILIGGRNNFGHFIFEILPKIFYMKKFLKDGYKFLIINNFPVRFLDYCKAFGVCRSDFICVDDWTNVTVNDLICTGSLVHRHRVNRAPALSLSVFKLMREAIVDWAFKQDTEYDARPIILISRLHERWRRVVNEASIATRLVDAGLAPHTSLPHLLTASDQVRQINSSQIIITPIGGASPSVLFMGKGATVVEMTNSRIDGVFAHRTWCAVAGGRLEQISGYFDEHCDNNGELVVDQDFKVEPDAIVAAVCRAII